MTTEADFKPGLEDVPAAKSAVSFLDGKKGFLFHFLQGFWFRLLVDVHLDDLLNGKETATPA